MDLEEILKIGETFTKLEKKEKELSFLYETAFELYENILKIKYHDYYRKIIKLYKLDLPTGEDRFRVDEFLANFVTGSISQNKFERDMRRYYDEVFFNTTDYPSFNEFFKEKKDKFVEGIEEYELLKKKLSESTIKLIEE